MRNLSPEGDKRQSFYCLFTTLPKAICLAVFPTTPPMLYTFQTPFQAAHISWLNQDLGNNMNMTLA